MSVTTKTTKKTQEENKKDGSGDAILLKISIFARRLLSTARERADVRRKGRGLWPDRVHRGRAKRKFCSNKLNH